MLISSSSSSNSNSSSSSSSSSSSTPAAHPIAQSFTMVPTPLPSSSPLKPQPMHLHGERFWLLSAGTGVLQDCIDDNSYVEGTPTFYGDTANVPFPLEEDVVGGYIKIRTQYQTPGGMLLLLLLLLLL